MSLLQSSLRRSVSAAAAPSIRSNKNSTSIARRTLAAAASSDEPLRKTSLNQWHRDLGGEMVPFAGYELPVFYKGENAPNGGVMKEHLWCRSEGKASLFDVSHMGQIRWHGADRAAFIEKVVVGDIQGLEDGQGLLSLITNDQGGIMDDTVITNAGDFVYMVVNGATKFGDMEHFQQHLDQFEGDVTMEYLEDTMQLLALQGPGAAAAVAKILPADFNLTSMAFMTGADVTLDGGIEGCRITRCGYTGEDGFEIAVPAEHCEAIASRLVDDPSVNPTGLGARDSLRLEAGLCLYGNDLDETTNPVEGTLAWTLGRPGSRRRTEQGFCGADKFLTPEGKLRKQSRKRIGIMGMKAPAREGTEIYDSDDNLIGTVTSGTYSPCLKKPIAMGYVESGLAKAGTPIQLKIRNKMQAAEVTKMPFVESRYYRVPE